MELGLSGLATCSFYLLSQLPSPFHFFFETRTPVNLGFRDLQASSCLCTALLTPLLGPLCMWVLRSDLGSSSLYSKHFVHGAI